MTGYLICMILALVGRNNGQIAFSLSRTLPHEEGTALFPVLYDIVHVNVGGAYNETNGIFTVPDTGSYYVSFGSCAAPNRTLDYMFRTGSWPVLIDIANVYKTSTVHNGIDTAHRGLSRYTNRNVAFAMQVSSSSGMYNDVFGQTSFNGMQIDLNSMVFTVANQNSIFGSMDPYTFDTVLNNIGSGWNDQSNSFRVPLENTGIYFFSISAGAMVESFVTMEVKVNNSTYVDLFRNSVNHDGVDTLSRSMLIELDDTDVVTVAQSFGSWSYSDAYIQTSFTGFQVSTLIETDWPAFFVGRTTSWDDVFTLSPVPFDEVLVNHGGLFSADSMVVPEDGVYFISFSAGAQNGRRVLLNLRITIGGYYVASVIRDSDVHIGTDTLSRDVILQLTEGERLHMEADAGSALYSDVYLQTSWLAFKIA